MIQIKNNKERDLDKLCRDHYESVLGSIVTRLNKNIEKMRSDDCFLENKCEIKEFIWYLSSPAGSSTYKPNLEQIITCKPEKFDTLFETFDRKFGLANSFNDKEVVKLFKSIFDYSSFSRSNRKYSAYDLVRNIGITTCPYCNRNFINTLEVKKRNGKRVSKLRPALDHFYPQREYPIFALSFYNLIPSCDFCNSNLKGGTGCTVKTHIHPYYEQFGNDGRFEYCCKNLPDNTGETILVVKNTGKRKRIENSKELFQLDSQYSIHKDIAKEIFEKALSDNEVQFDTIQSAIKKIKPSKKEFYQFYFGNYIEESDFEKRPLSKFTRDLVEDLGIMEKLGYSDEGS